MLSGHGRALSSFEEGISFNLDRKEKYSYKRLIGETSVSLRWPPPLSLHEYIMTSLYTPNIYALLNPAGYTPASPLVDLRAYTNDGGAVDRAELSAPLRVVFPLDTNIPQVEAISGDLFERRTRTPQQIID